MFWVWVLEQLRIYLLNVLDATHNMFCAFQHLFGLWKTDCTIHIEVLFLIECSQLSLDP